MTIHGMISVFVPVVNAAVVVPVGLGAVPKMRLVLVVVGAALPSRVPRMKAVAFCDRVRVPAPVLLSWTLAPFPVRVTRL